MATIFNETTVAPEPSGNGAARQRLLTDERVKGIRILLDRLTLQAGGELKLTVASTSVAWLQILDGEVVLTHAGARQTLSDAHVVFLPPGAAIGLSSAKGVALLYGETPNAPALDPSFDASAMSLRVMDWTREPVLDSVHDNRKRIYLVTPKLFGTKAVKGEMIIYPPGTSAANHHHVGAEHFMYVLRGGGTVYANEQPFPVRAGDVIYYPDLERHYLEASQDGEMVFVEFFAPAEHKTVWVDASQVCTWTPTGRDIHGQAPAREIKAHASDQVLSPEDV